MTTKQQKPDPMAEDNRNELLKLAYIPPDAKNAPLQLFNVDELLAYTTNKIIEARLEELKWSQMQFSGLDKSHVGRSYYNRNTAFKNYAVKFWNNRVKTIRDKFDDRIKELEGK